MHCHLAATPVYRIGLALAVMGFSALLSAGCGSGGPVMGRVSGTVTYKGKPIEKGAISFTPTDGQRPSATGVISNGSYTLQTTEPGDGAVVGEYRVAINDIDPNDYPDLPGMPVKAAKGIMPKKYLDANSSGQTAKVEKGSNTINFDLD